MTPFMVAVQDALDGCAVPEPATERSCPVPLPVATDAQVMIRSLAEQLVCEANAVLREAGDLITLDDECVEPMMNGLGGDVWAMVWWEDARCVHGLNASGRCPGGLSASRFAGRKTMPAAGWEAVTVPGAADGYTALHERFASRPLAELAAPAVAYARDGFPVGETIGAVWAVGAGKLKQFGGVEYLLDGRAPAPGERFRHPALADTWELFGREGRDGIYTGPVARELVRAFSASGSGLTEADLAAQRAEWAEPISLEYRGRRILEMPPNGQGISRAGHPGLRRPRQAGGWRSRPRIDREGWRVGIGGGGRCDRGRLLRDRIDPKMARPQPDIGRDLGDTTYLCVVDAAGNAVSLITSISSAFGAGVVAGSTGVVMNDRGAEFSLDPKSPNLIAPGRRPRHSILPAMALRNGRPEIVFGCMGGMMQPQGHIQLMVNVLDASMGLQEAIDAPRYRILDGLDVTVDDGLDPEVIADLERRGHRLPSPEKLPPGSRFKGSAQMIRFHRDQGSLEGGTVHRLDGVAIGL